MHSGDGPVTGRAQSPARAAIFGVSGQALSRTEHTFFRDADPWGFILFLRNIESPEQVRRLVGQLRESVGRDAPILIDQEGGRVSRLLPPTWSRWDNAREFVGHFPTALQADAMTLRYHIIALELADLGIDVNCAPMVDVARTDTHPMIAERCYGTDAASVAELGRAVALGLERGGVLPVLKHIPGHGRTALDSHDVLPRIDTPLEVLEAEDFGPFAALSDLPIAMTAHIVYQALDPDQPVTLSAAAVAQIRTRLGFQGLLLTDDLSMHALDGPMRARVSGAVAAGCDVMLHCNGDFAEMLAVADAAPRLSGESQRRADAALARCPERRPDSLTDLKRKMQELLTEVRLA